MTEKQLDFQFSIDRGGTFTDLYIEIYEKNTNNLIKSFVYKLLSEDKQYGDGPKEGIRRILEQELGMDIPLHSKIPAKFIRSLRMGTTVATNALLERKGAKTALIVTKGFKDLLHIGNQTRPFIFDLTMNRAEKIYEKVLEVDERVRIISDQEKESGLNYAEQTIIENDFKDILEVKKQINRKLITEQLQALKDEGIEALSIVFMHSPAFPDHELTVEKIAQEIGFKQISLSHKIMPMIKIVPRGYTTTLDAYLNPYITDYINNFISGFDDQIKNINIFFMQSDGGLSSIDSFRGSRSILSGPAGGVIGYSATGQNILDQNKEFKGIIGFDMGGTSTDVSTYDGEKFDHIFDAQIAGIQINTPHLDINTVAAGGGSRLMYQNGLLKVGPESAGALPGPVCYGQDGYLAVTDANLMLGRLVPKYFPKIFGPKKDEPLFYNETYKQMEQIAQQINADNKSKLTVQELASGFIKVANESMCRPIRSLTQGKGVDPRDFILSIFGGAGAQHGCSIAESLGIRKIFIHQYSGVLSAYGLSKADVVQDKSIPFSAFLNENDSIKTSQEFMDKIISENKEDLIQSGFEEKDITHQRYLSLLYEGTDTSLQILEPEDLDYEKQFTSRYMQEFGFILNLKKIKIESVRVRSIANKNPNLSKDSAIFNTYIEQKDIKPLSIEKVFFDIDNELCEEDTPAYAMEDLHPSSKLLGPALIINKTSTIVIEPDWQCTITSEGNIAMDQVNKKEKHISRKIKCNPIELSIFGNRFMSIAEQMGRTLQKTSCSTNIKERLDFSCALFAPDGSLVANAPHMPVHLGSMQETIRWQIKNYPDWNKDEVIMTNHPSAGGSHLPDITVITPIWQDNKPIFFVASRGHHADVGGSTPGSMPPFSRSLQEEGIAVKSFILVKDGLFNEKELTQLLTCSEESESQESEAQKSDAQKLEKKNSTQQQGGKGTRTLNDNISDLKAQVAANNQGVNLIQDLIREYSLEYVHAYMNFIQDNAEESVRNMLCTLSEENGMKEVDSILQEDYMDDGTKIMLKLTIDRVKREALFDFTGTGYEVLSNINCPKSVSMSAIIYCLRCLVNSDIPLNQGCLKPISAIIPENSLLNPGQDAPIVGGNVLTSQRITDTILKAFQACGDSQGCMNNFTFGNDKMSYYETICGGGGAGPTWNGQSGIQCHMTNTRITDPEIFERRYPVFLSKFQLREGSGGKGKFNGGDGVEREVQFMQPMKVCLITERRVFAPQGIRGGEAGQKGQNYLIDGEKIINLGAKNAIDVKPGQKILIRTPGGGGYGKVQDKQQQNGEQQQDNAKFNQVQFGSNAAFASKQETV